MRRRGRVVEGARLESVYRGDSIVGSNPTVSATTSIGLVRRSPNSGRGLYKAAISDSYLLHRCPPVAERRWG